MNDPIALFITWPTHGTWLLGDDRGWVELTHGWQLPPSSRDLESLSRMKEDVCLFSTAECRIVEKQIVESCKHRRWTLHAISCRSNHMHLVIRAVNTSPKQIREALKDWTTRRLKELSDQNRDQWWAERGSVRWISDLDELKLAKDYVKSTKEFEKKPDSQPASTT
jgi:REP element-mobilizing transposase RayT